MAGNQFIAEQLVKTTGFQDVDPTLLASGELGIYYCNSEKVVGDGGSFKDYGENAGGMWHHAVSMMDKNPDFRKIIEILAEEASRILPKEPFSLSPRKGQSTISGGQTRDWLFSAPVAHLLKLPHISLYKQVAGQPDRVEVHKSDGTPIPNFFRSAEGPFANLHIVDLITEGSSCYHKEADGRETGWIPMLRNLGVDTTDLVAVVTRYQNGEQNLANVGVKVHPMVGIDEEFLREHSQNPEAVRYFRDPEKWGKNFLRKRGAKMFARFFDPSGGKQDRAKRFVERYGKHLVDVNKFNALDEVVKTHYGLSICEIRDGRTLYKTTLSEKWRDAVRQKKSILCAGLDPAEYWQGTENTLPEGADKLQWCLDFIDKVAPYAAAVKPNGNFFENLSGEDKTKIVDRIHKHGSVAIWDRKLVDIGNTNDSGLYHAENFGFDAVTYSPFPGNFEEAATMAHNRGEGIIGMCIMSNPQHKTEKMKLADVTENPGDYHIDDIVEMEHPKLGHRKYVPQYVQLARAAAAYKWDGVVIGAPSPGNHVTLDEVACIKSYVGDNTLVLMPGVGAQGGDADNVIKIFGSNVIVNVGRAVLNANDPAKAAMQYRDMLNVIREKYKQTA
ncbi:MAG: orotidine 5'-phosphate decarboxylase [Candidatus Woesearchaeota archaeon]|nr:orotidine 5'-phosphate decarboxylase [Candidatus Woesearchaeota archaeon]